MHPSHLPRRTVEKKELLSVHLGRTRKIRVSLPPDYDPNRKYPVIYCQDGEQFFNYGRIVTSTLQLILAQQMEPVVIVGVDVDLRTRTSEYAPDGARYDAYCSFFMNELLPYVEQHYSVLTDRDGRLIAGDSLGGTVSLHLALDHPDDFGRILSFSGAFFNSTQEHIKRYHDLSTLNVYMLVGLQETEVKTERGTFDFLQMNRETRNALAARGAVMKYIEDDGEHKWGFWQQYMADALRYFFP